MSEMTHKWRLRNNNIIMVGPSVIADGKDLEKLNGTPIYRLADVSKDDSELRMASNEGASYSSQCPKSDAKKWPNAESITELGYAFGFHIAVFDMLHLYSYLSAHSTAMDPGDDMQRGVAA
jgi:hypothetical protein